MKQYLLLTFIFFLIWNCKPDLNNNRSYYFYDLEEILKTSEFKFDTMTIQFYTCVKPTFISWSDSITFKSGHKIYQLLHYNIFGSSHYKDTTFIKNKSILDSIKYFDSEWLKVEDNLNKFWNPSEFKGGLDDSTEIYIVEPIQGSDSLIFKRIHRVFLPAMEGM